MRIPQSVIQEIYNRADIVEVISEYVPLKKRGSNYWALSPFKQEKTPSFAVSPSKGIYKCFSTGKGGNVVNFLMEMEGFSYLEAIKHLAQKYNVDISSYEAENGATSAKSEENYEKAESLRILHKFACQYYQKQLKESEEGQKEALVYFHKRGLSHETIELFQLGYAKSGLQEFTQYALQAQYREEILVESGLCIKSEKNGKLYDRFHGRIIFPLIDVWGKVVGFAGRLIQETAGAPKYLNSPESPIYHKGRFLFGLHLAKTAIREQNLCFVVEGYMDMISLYQAGIKNVVAVGGTSLTAEQLQLLKRYTNSLILLFDGDAAGIKAAQRAIALALENNMRLLVLQLPQEQDPDSYIQQYGKEAFLELVASNAKDFLGFYFAIRKDEIPKFDPFQKVAFIQELVTLIAKIPDSLQRALYIQQLAEGLKVQEEEIANRVEEAIRQIQKVEAKVATPNQKLDIQGLAIATHLEFASYSSSETWAQERELLRLWLLYAEEQIAWEGEIYRVADVLYQNLHDVEFENPIFQKIKSILVFEYEQNNLFDTNIMFGPDVEEDILGVVTDLQVQKYTLSENWLRHDILAPQEDSNLSKCVESALDHFQLKKINQLHKQNQEKIKEIAQKPECFEELINLMKRQQRIEQLRKELALKLGLVITSY
ncbi:MAG: DNA primase [Bacteroidia bacterium]|nr:DNA primase [Bacteroidia bacterium]MDW8157541.1 DNA primase [Bacteroidia bacterium]